MSSPVKAKYGLPVNVQLNDYQAEMLAFRIGWKSEDGGLGRYRHYRNVCKILFPNLEWNPWLEDISQALCSDEHAVKSGNNIFRSVALAGCGSAGKTFGVGRFAYVWFQAHPANSIVILTSTTIGAVGRRIWPIIQESYRESRESLAKVFGAKPEDVDAGHLIDSKKMLQAKRGDEKHAIFAMAVAQGETHKALENIKGMHAPRIMLVVDEATGTPEAICKAITNLRKACQELVVVFIGNPVSKLDCHGRACQPRDGWDSVNQLSESWPTKGVPEWQLEPGICLHFSGSNSPNVKAGRTLHKHIYTWEDYQAAISSKGRDTIEFWSQDEGFWAPDGTVNTVLTMSLITAHNAMDGKQIFISKATPIAALDPAFGGDQCKLRFGLLGDIAKGKLGIQLTDSVSIKINPLDKRPAEYQISAQVKSECAKRGVKPSHFGSDSTGTGRGLFSLMYEDIGSDIYRVEFGGPTSELPASEDDLRPSKEVYDRRVTELWFWIRSLVKSDQLKGINLDEAIQLTSRQYTLKGEKKYSVETKEDMKKKLNRSPDDADALSVLCDLARKLGLSPGGKVARSREKSLEKHAEATSRVYESIDYSADDYYPDEAQAAA